MPRKRSKSPKHRSRSKSRAKSKAKSRSKSKNRKYGGGPKKTNKIKYGISINTYEWINNEGKYFYPNPTIERGFLTSKIANTNPNYTERIPKMNEGNEVGAYIVKEWREGTETDWKYRETHSESNAPIGIPESRIIVEKGNMSFDDKFKDTPCKIVYVTDRDNNNQLFLKVYYCAKKFWCYIIPSDFWNDPPKDFRTKFKNYNSIQEMESGIYPSIVNMINNTKDVTRV
jgi:hypothetical protein